MKGVRVPRDIRTSGNKSQIRWRHPAGLPSWFPTFRCTNYVLLRGIVPHTILPLVPVEEKQFSVSLVREPSSKLQPKCIHVLFIPICSNASTIF